MYLAVNSRQHRGFALLIALVLTSVVLALGMALIDIAYKQVVLASSAKNSQYAFYNADSALECALYYDQKQGAFFYNSTYNSPITCSNLAVTSFQPTQNATARTTTFRVPCASGGISADVTIIKDPSNNTNIFATGYSSCDPNNSTRIERGLKVKY